MNKRTIGFISFFVPPIISGVSTVVQTKVNWLTKHGYKAILVTGNDVPNRLKDANLLVVHLDELNELRIAYIAYLKAEHDNLEQINKLMARAAHAVGAYFAKHGVICSHSEHELAQVAAEGLQVPHVMVIHGPWPRRTDIEREGMAYYRRASYGEQRYRTFTPDATITVSRFIRQRWANTYDIDESKISVIHNPIDLNRFRPNPRHDRSYVRSRLGISEDAEVIYYPQRLAKLGVHVLFQAIAILRRWRPQVRLLITTSDRLMSSRQEQAKNLGIEDLLHLRLLGDLDISRAYRAVDAVVAPNHYEGFGLPALEALACGVPVVACHSGAYLETLKDHRTALLFQPKNAEHLAACLNEILSDHDLKRRLVQEGLTEVKKFGADKVLPLYERRFREVLKLDQGVGTKR